MKIDFVKGCGSMWNCLLGSTLIYHEINRKSNVLYPGSEFLSRIAFDVKKEMSWIYKPVYH